MFKKYSFELALSCGIFSNDIYFVVRNRVVLEAEASAEAIKV